MKTFLMHKNQDFDIKRSLPLHEQTLTQDLELNTLFNAMARGDKFLFEVARKALLSGLDDPDAIVYRQHVVGDCVRNATIVRDMYQITIESIENKKARWMGIFTHYPRGILSSSVEMLQMFVELLKKLRNFAYQYANRFESEGFSNLFAMIKRELDDEYFASIQDHLKRLRLRDGVLMSAELGKGNEGINYVFRKPNSRNQNWVKQILTSKSPVYTFYIHPRDDSGARAVADLTDIGINLVANALAQSADHIDSFFNMLRIELAFYIGCLNLYEQLSEIGAPISFPLPVSYDKRRHTFQGLYDVCLALTMKQKIVGNDVNANEKNLVMITGANQGGKSTFLRSIGLSQLMMQCGMFVPAEAFCANVCEGLFTHYKREEDATMKSGKLDEELVRMSDIVDHVTSNSIVLFNESFAATNEREGSEIARQIVRALLEKGIKVFFVTHLYELAYGFYNKDREIGVFLRAERQSDGSRTFRLIEAEPLQTSYGKDLYKRIFETNSRVHTYE